MSKLKHLIADAVASLEQFEGLAEKTQRLTDIADETLELVPDVKRSHIVNLVSRADDAAFQTVLGCGTARARVEAIKAIIDDAPENVAGLLEFIPTRFKEIRLFPPVTSDASRPLNVDIVYVFNRAELERLLVTAFLAGRAQ